MIRFDSAAGTRTTWIGADYPRFWRTVAQTRKGFWCLGSGSESRMKSRLPLVWRNFCALDVLSASEIILRQSSRRQIYASSWVLASFDRTKAVSVPTVFARELTLSTPNRHSLR